MIEGPKPRLRGAHGTTTTGDEAEGRPNRIRGGSTRPRNSNRTRVVDTRQSSWASCWWGQLVAKVGEVVPPSTFGTWDSDQDERRGRGSE